MRKLIAENFERILEKNKAVNYNIIKRCQVVYAYNNDDYLNTLESIKEEILSAQYKAAVNANRELILLYYQIGQVINEHKAWGNKFIDNLAADIRMSFPGVTGYSVRNLKYMAKFAETYDIQFVQTVSA